MIDANCGDGKIEEARGSGEAADSALHWSSSTFPKVDATNPFMASVLRPSGACL